MAKEKWLIDPAELDEFQRGIRGMSLAASYAVKGCAGSGKTILALYRANDVRIQAKANDQNPSFTMVVYTKALRSFIRSGIRELGLNLRQVIHHNDWDQSEVDYIIVDEAQDFSKEQVDELNNARKQSITLYGDSKQQIYKNKAGGVMSMEEIATHLGIPERELQTNYRLPKLIASFAAHLTNDKGLESRCIKPGSQKPKLKKFATWQAELDFIMNEITTRNFTDVAILLPFNNKQKAPYNNFHRNVETVKEYFDEKNFSHEFKIKTTDGDSNELDFDSDLPKVMCFHSSKGLQFETVFIPFCDYPQHDNWFIDKYQNALYVGLTRTYRNLYLTHSQRLTPFFANIPSHKYE